MGMTPDEFFGAFVIGNYEDYQENPDCVRRAFNAAVSASHLADHYYEYYQKHDKSKVKNFAKIGDFVEHLSKNTNGCFRDIRSISNAYKHLYTKKDVHSSISSTGAIESISWVAKNATVKAVEVGEVSGSNNGKLIVIYTRKDGQCIEFSFTLNTVIKYWSAILGNVL